MHLVFYDIESTGLGSKDEVIQFGAIITDMNLHLVKVINKYSFTNMQIDPGAYAVHQLTLEDVYKYSRGKYFEEIVEEEKALFRDSKNLIWIGYNDKADKRLINQTLENNGITPINFGRKISMIDHSLKKGVYNLDAMDLFVKALNGGRKGKLGYFVHNHAGIDFDRLQDVYKKFTKRLSFVSPRDGAHDAVYDSFVVWWIMSQHKDRMFI